MEKTLINQAVKNAVGQEGRENTSVQAEKTDPAELSAREFEDFLASIVTGVIQNVVDVRAGKLKPDEASSRDDATVRTLAQILMGEHERIRLMLAPGTPKPGPELVAAMKARRNKGADVSGILELDEKRREVIQKTEQLKAKRNEDSAKVPVLKKQGQDVSALLAEMKLVADDIKELDAELAQIDAQFDDLLMKIPNIPHSSVPDGADEAQNEHAEESR